MTDTVEGRAIVYCEGAFSTTNGKTAHGLVRRSRRYEILAVVDSSWRRRDAGNVLDGIPAGIPIVGSVEEAVTDAAARRCPATHLVMGLTPDGGRMPDHARQAVVEALRLGLHVVSGLHDFLSEDPELVTLAEEHGVTLHDVRKPPDRKALHGFTGTIESVGALRVALLGTDSAAGKRTTAWLLVDALIDRGHPAELVGTGQTAWLQGARHCIVLDSLINDFIAGEIEHAVVTAWEEERPEVIVVEGQGSLMNPAYPGGYEILAAARPHCVVMQHVPSRREYDGFPGYPLHSLPRQIQAVELVSSRPVVAVTISSEGLDDEGVCRARDAMAAETGLPVVEPIRDGLEPVLAALEPYLESRRRRDGGEEASP